MKKSLLVITAAAAFVASLPAYADVTGVVEYNYNRITRAGESHYGAAGLVYSPSKAPWFVDGYVQTSNAFVGPRDNMLGWEAGAGYRFPVAGALSGSTRFAYGTMGNINYGSTRAHYLLGSVELNYALTDKLAGYASYSHTHGTNATAIPAVNRAQVGVDYKLTDGLWSRVGLSSARQQETWVNGVVVTFSKGF